MRCRSGTLDESSPGNVIITRASAVRRQVSSVDPVHGLLTALSVQIKRNGTKVTHFVHMLLALNVERRTLLLL